MSKSVEYNHNPVLSQIAVDYQNNELIGPRLIDTVDVDSETGTYFKYGASAAFDQYDDTAEQDSVVSETKSKKIKTTFLVKDRALRECVNAKVKLEAAFAGFDELADVTETVTGHIMLNDEIRVSSLYFNVNNYLAANRLVAGAGASPGKWDTANGDPLKDIMRMLDLLIGRGLGRTIVTFGQLAWRNLSTNAKVKEAVQYTGLGGIVPVAPVKEILGVDDILIGNGFKHTGNPNSDEDNLSLSRIWGDFVAITVQQRGTPSRRKPSFATKFRLKVSGRTFNTYTYRQPERGGHGSDWVQVAMDDTNETVAKPYGAIISATST